MSERTEEIQAPEETEIVEQSALKPLIYILILPLALIALIQWSGLPAVMMNALTGH